MTTSPAVVSDLAARGVISSASPPMVIDRVSYGRVMYFNPTRAAPLTFGLRTLDGSPVATTESGDVQRMDCRRTASPFAFALEIDRVDGSGTLDGVTRDSLLGPGANEIKLRYRNLGCDARFRAWTLNDIDRARVFAIDDHQSFSATIALVIEAIPGFGLIGTARSGPEGLALLGSGVEPHLLLIDVVMTPLSGSDVAKHYRRAGGRAPMVLMSRYAIDDLPLASSGSATTGIYGFIAKDELDAEGLATLWSRITSTSPLDLPTS